LIDIPNDPISFLEAVHVISHFIHFASHVTAKDGGPLLHEDAGILHVAVKRVDGDCSIPHNELSGTCRGRRSVAHVQRSVGFEEPCGLIRRCRHSFFLFFSTLLVFKWVGS
jgi:hypothetical protein